MELTQQKGAGTAASEKDDTPTTVKKYRVQLDFNPKEFHEVNSLVEELGLTTRAELFRSALVALRWMVQKKRTGCTIVAVTPSERLLEPEFEFLQALNSTDPKWEAATATM